MVPSDLAPPTDAMAHQASQALTTEWLVTLLRWVVLGIFAFLRHYVAPAAPVDAQLLYFFLLLGAVYNLYVTYLLHTEAVQRDFPHFMAFFLFTDTLLLAALGYFSSLYQSGLLTFYYFLVILVGLRASLRISFILGPMMVLAYILSTFIVQGPLDQSAKRLLVDSVSLVTLTVFCGWFAEGKSRAWRLISHLTRRLRSTTADLGQTRRQLMQYRYLDEMRNNFMAIMSHELRTPLTNIIGFNDLLLMEEIGPLTPDQKECLRDMLEKSLELSRLIENLLDLFRIQSGRFGLRFEDTVPETLVQGAVSALAPAAEKKQITVETVAAGTPLPKIPVDRQKIVRVLVNLIDNAINFSPKGSRITVGFETAVDAQLAANYPHLITSSQAVRFSVVDAGPGIPPADRERIFDRLYRFDEDGPRHPGQGAGLGLSIAQEIVSLHWGKIWCGEGPGGGGAFYFTLPVSPVRLARRIDLVRAPVNVANLLEGLLRQFDDDLARKKMTVDRGGFLTSGRPLTVSADRQLLQSVLFNVLGNNIRYAFAGSELAVSLETSGARSCVIEVRNHGKAIDPRLIDDVRRGNGAAGSRPPGDMRRVNVNMSLGRDIIESHGGSYQVDDCNGEGLSTVITLPLAPEETREGVSDGRKKSAHSG